jgi:iron complex transport system substrate-binding protein
MPARRSHLQRIVSLAPSATSTLVAIGARRHLVGVSKWCNEVADVRHLPQLGDCWSLDVAEVERLKPTLVVGSVPFKPEVVAKLLELPINFLAQSPRTLADIFCDIRTLGAFTGRPASSERLIARMQRAFARVEAQARRLPRHPTVYCEAWPNPRISSPRWVAELVAIAGGRMVVPPGQRLADEEIIRANPDVIILAWTATGLRARPEELLRNPAWFDVAAVRTRRVYVVRDDYLNTPGLPLIHGVTELLRYLRLSQ